MLVHDFARSISRVIVVLASALCPKISVAESPPNIVVIFSDDQGYADVGVFGAKGFSTPHLDRMCAEGMKFTDFYSAAAVCSPSRAALLTGRYAIRTGVTKVLFPHSLDGLPPEEITLAELLKSRGYATACIGKWHLGHRPEFLPERQGFDEYYGVPYPNDMRIDPAMAIAGNVVLREGMTLELLRSGPPRANWIPLMRGEEVIEYPVDQATLTKRYTEEAIRFMTEHRERPFFLYLPHTMPHIPLFASADFKGRSRQGLYGDVIEELDWSVGEILKTLKSLEIDEKTLVVFTSDNGPWLAKEAHGGAAMPLRDGKFSTYEGGMRVPCLIRWPGRIPAGSVCGEVCGTIDLLPTLARLAGAELPAGRVIDGRDIWPLLSGRPGARSPHEAIFYFRATAVEGVRAGKWKYRQAARGSHTSAAPPARELYDLERDIGEQQNRADEFPEVVSRLSKLIERARTEIVPDR